MTICFPFTDSKEPIENVLQVKDPNLIILIKMDQAKQNKFILFLLIGLIVIAFGLTAFLYHMFSSDGGKCIANPMKFAEEKIVEANSGKALIVCQCMDARKGGMVVDINWSEILNGTESNKD